MSGDYPMTEYPGKVRVMHICSSHNKKDDRLRKFLVDAPADHFFVGYIPEDLRLEPEKTPLEE